MRRPEITIELSRLLETHLKMKDPRVYMAKEVTFDYATDHPVRVDYMRFKPVNNTVSGIEKGDFYCYEIKSCVEDFQSKHGHNFLGDYNYYVMPFEVYEKVSGIIPYYVGVYVPHESDWPTHAKELTQVRKAQRHSRTRPVSEMLLMMFRSFARDERKGG